MHEEFNHLDNIQIIEIIRLLDKCKCEVCQKEIKKRREILEYREKNLKMEA